MIVNHETREFVINLNLLLLEAEKEIEKTSKYYTCYKYRKLINFASKIDYNINYHSENNVNERNHRQYHLYLLEFEEIKKK
jgi:hypothetical protein